MARVVRISLSNADPFFRDNMDSSYMLKTTLWVG